MPTLFVVFVKETVSEYTPAARPVALVTETTTATLAPGASVPVVAERFSQEVDLLADQLRTLIWMN